MRLSIIFTHQNQYSNEFIVPTFCFAPVSLLLLNELASFSLPICCVALKFKILRTECQYKYDMASMKIITLLELDCN